MAGPSTGSGTELWDLSLPEGLFSKGNPEPVEGAVNGEEPLLRYPSGCRGSSVADAKFEGRYPMAARTG